MMVFLTMLMVLMMMLVALLCRLPNSYPSIVLVELESSLPCIDTNIWKRMEVSVESSFLVLVVDHNTPC
jgi:hypothetical protein